MEELEQDDYVYPGKRFSRDGCPTGHGQGMTLRDWFAGQALVGMLAHSTRYKPRNPNIGFHEAIAQESYELADAMLAARKANNGQ